MQKELENKRDSLITKISQLFRNIGTSSLSFDQNNDIKISVDVFPNADLKEILRFINLDDSISFIFWTPLSIESNCKYYYCVEEFIQLISIESIFSHFVEFFFKNKNYRQYLENQFINEMTKEFMEYVFNILQKNDNDGVSDQLCPTEGSEWMGRVDL